MKTISFRIDETKLKKLDELSSIENIDISTMINNLITEKLEFLEWQKTRIHKAISHANKNRFSKDTEIIKLLLD